MKTILNSSTLQPMTNTNILKSDSALWKSRVPGLDFEELGLVSGIVIPPKFKVPLFSKYDGVSFPKMHIRSNVRKIQPHSTDKDWWVHLFQDSLPGTQLDWFDQLERADVHN